jgi:hypothetical protein
MYVERQMGGWLDGCKVECLGGWISFYHSHLFLRVSVNCSLLILVQISLVLITQKEPFPVW